MELDHEIYCAFVQRLHHRQDRVPTSFHGIGRENDLHGGKHPGRSDDSYCRPYQQFFT